MNLEESFPHLGQILGGAGVSLIKPQMVHCHFGALVIWNSFGSERFFIIPQAGHCDRPTLNFSNYNLQGHKCPEKNYLQ
jgi:hypothetical protein